MNYPKIGIRPTIDGRRKGIRESLEDQTMNMAKQAAELFTAKLRYADGTLRLFRGNGSGNGCCGSSGYGCGCTVDFFYGYVINDTVYGYAVSFHNQ